MSTRTTADAVDWPKHDDGRTQLGMWRVSEGEFTTRHEGYVESVTTLRGHGRLVHDSGEAIALYPGVVAVMESGWAGRWVIEEPLVKAYAVVNDA